MKTLLIVRHAKSSWQNPELSDFARPLNSRGESTAPFMGRLLREREIVPDIILASPAARAERTAELIRTAGGFAVEIRLIDQIYEASPGRLLDALSDTATENETVMLVGHNPGVEGLIRVLTGQTERMPTAAVAVVTLEIDLWSDVAPDLGKLAEIYRPKDELQRTAAF